MNNTFDAVVAAAGLLVCAALLLRMALGEVRRNQLDAVWRRFAARWPLRFKAQRPWVVKKQPPRRDQTPAHAAEEARRAIQRARLGTLDADRVGNVIRPRAFKNKPDADDRLH